MGARWPTKWDGRQRTRPTQVKSPPGRVAKAWSPQDRNQAGGATLPSWATTAGQTGGVPNQSGLIMILGASSFGTGCPWFGGVPRSCDQRHPLEIWLDEAVAGEAVEAPAAWIPNVLLLLSASTCARGR